MKFVKLSNRTTPVLKIKNWNGVISQNYFKNGLMVVEELVSNVEKGTINSRHRWFNHLDPTIKKDKELT